MRERKEIYPSTHQVLVGGERFAFCLFAPHFKGKYLMCPIKVIAYSSQKYFSLLGTGHMLVFSLMQFLVSSDPPNILRVALHLLLHPSANKKINVPGPSAIEFSVPGSASQPQSCSEGWPKEMVKSCPRLTRWHCVWLPPALTNLRQSLA